MKASQRLARRRTNDGASSSYEQVLPIRPELLAKLTAEFYEPLKRAPGRVFHGPKGRRADAKITSSISDDQVLAIRRMRDWHGMTVKQICEITGLKKGSVTNIVGYTTRSHLYPGERPAPDAEVTS